MNEGKNLKLINCYINAYNGFDIDGMMAVIHSEIEFENISKGIVNATAVGAEAFRKLAEQSKSLFLSRKQTVKNSQISSEVTVVEIEYEGVLAVDLPNGMKAGETLRLKGRSEFSFREGLISSIRDIS